VNKQAKMTEVEKPPSSHMKDSRPTPISAQQSNFESRRDSKKSSTQIKATDGVGVVSEAAEENFSYREISDLSEATEDNVPGEGKRQDELDDYERLMAGTQKSALHMHEEPEGSDSVGGKGKKAELADEFLRNFFIKFGMKTTLENFQQEWFEKKAQGKLDLSKIPDIPQIYRKNAELTDELQVLQEELDEARIVAEKARSTYDKLRK